MIPPPCDHCGATDTARRYYVSLDCWLCNGPDLLGCDERKMAQS